MSEFVLKGLVGAVLVAIISIVPMLSFACSCLLVSPETDEFRSHVADTSIIVLGTPVHQRLLPGSYGITEIHFEVSRAWKGPGSGTLLFRTKRNTSCVYTFELGRRHLIFAEPYNESVYTTSQCQYNQRGNAIEAFVTKLDELEKG